MLSFPQQGDIIWISFDPQSGHEQAGRRPALVVSGNDAIRFMPNLVLVCPISNTDNGFPLHVALDENSNTTGFVFCEHLKALDIQARNAEWKGHASDEVVAEVLDIIKGLLE